MTDIITETHLEEASAPTSPEMKKWAPVLNHRDFAPIKESKKKRDLVNIIENTVREDRMNPDRDRLMLSESPVNVMGTSSSTTGAGAIDTYDPIIVSLLRRAMPNLIAYDFVGVQPMKGPTGLVFAKRTRLTNQTGAETFYGEPNTAYSARGGSNTAAANAGYASATVPGGAANNVGGSFGISNNAGNSTYNYAGGVNRVTSENMGGGVNNLWPQMAFSIEKTQVTANSRQMQATYSLELAQDLKSIHGLDAETELTNDISAELISEINREIVRTVYVTAVPGAQVDTTTPGVFDLDTDSNGRWSAEKYKGLYMQIERDANQIAKDTRRGRGNLLIVSSDVASALEMAGKIDFSKVAADLNVDDTGATLVGTLNGKYKVFIDPYAPAGFNFYVAGYKGPTWTDAGLFYCPYVPITMIRAVDPALMTPIIGFKTRYGMVANPFAQGLTQGYGAINQDSNLYYRRVVVQHLL
jgi:hypothetical protein